MEPEYPQGERYLFQPGKVCLGVVPGYPQGDTPTIYAGVYSRGIPLRVPWHHIDCGTSHPFIMLFPIHPSISIPTIELAGLHGGDAANLVVREVGEPEVAIRAAGDTVRL